MEKSDRFDAAQSSEGRYRLLVEAITDYAIYMLDRDGHVTSWNPGAKRFKGYEAEEIIGHHFSTFYTETEREQKVPAAALEEAERTGRFEREGWRVRKDGTQFWAHVIIDAIRSPIFTDVMMPGSLRSPDFARKAKERLPNVAVLFTSGYTQNAIVHGGRLDPGWNSWPNLTRARRSRGKSDTCWLIKLKGASLRDRNTRPTKSLSRTRPCCSSKTTTSSA